MTGVIRMVGNASSGNPAFDKDGASIAGGKLAAMMCHHCLTPKTKRVGSFHA